MKTDTNVLVAQRALATVWNGASPADLEVLFADGFEFRNLGNSPDVMNLDGLRGRILSLRAAHPGGHFHLEDAAGTGERVIVWWSYGVNGPRPASLGAEARIRLAGTSFVRLQGGQVAELWELGGQMEQPLGA